jgi:hypothetical protein
VPLIPNFGDPFRIRLDACGPQDHRSFVAGLYDGYADVASTGHDALRVRDIQVLSPMTAAAWERAR